jgi:hypothetical protein
MAATKKATKTVKEESLKDEVLVEKTSEEKGSSELDELKAMLLEFKRQNEESIKQNEELIKQNKELQERLSAAETVTPMKSIPLDGIILQTNNEEKIYVVHMCEMMGGLTTHISLSDTTRDLRRLGEIMTLTQSQFEELKGKYLHYFEKGILAMDARNVEIATMNHLPIYDTVTQGHYNPKVINDLGRMSKDQLRDLYNNLSHQNRQNVIGIWLNKCYSKDPNYLDREKLEFLSKLTEGSDFDDIIFELINNERMNLQNAAPVQKIGTV